MLELPAAILPKYKRLIDEGFATTLTDGMALEQQYAREWNNANTGSVLAGGGMAALQARARKGA
jgi:enoyl-CoA hydratase